MQVELKESGKLDNYDFEDIYADWNPLSQKFNFITAIHRPIQGNNRSRSFFQNCSKM